LKFFNCQTVIVFHK